MAKRLEWVLCAFKPWTLSNRVEAEDRQQAIIDAVESGQHIVIVPYRRVNEGLNLQKVIDTIIWYEQSMNLFLYLQASQRAWRLGKQEEVRIYLPFYFGTAAHTKMRKLGGQSGAAAAFAGEPAKGELIKQVGADQTTLARLSASLEENALFDDAGALAVDDDVAQIEAAFARRNGELAAALKQGRQWFGVKDTLAERRAAVLASDLPEVWATVPPTVFLPEEMVSFVQREPEDGAQPTEMEEMPEPMITDVITPPTTLPAEKLAPEPAEPRPAPVHLVQGAPSREPVVLVFGNEEDIKRARKRQRGRQRRLFPRLKNPVIVKDIPAEPLSVAMAPEATPPEKELVVTSLWEVSLVSDEQTHVA